MKEIKPAILIIKNSVVKPRITICDDPFASRFVTEIELKPGYVIPATNPGSELYYLTKYQILEGLINENIDLLYVWSPIVELNRRNVPPTVKILILNNYRKDSIEQELLGQFDEIYIHHWDADKFWSDQESYLSNSNVKLGIFIRGYDRGFISDKYFDTEIDGSNSYNKLFHYRNYYTMLLVTGKRKITEPIESKIKFEPESEIKMELGSTIFFRKLSSSYPDFDIIIIRTKYELRSYDEFPVIKPNSEYHHDSESQIPVGIINGNITTLYVSHNDYTKLSRKNVPPTVKTIIIAYYKKENFEQELLDQLDTLYVHVYCADNFWSHNKLYLSKININLGVFSYGNNYFIDEENLFGEEYFGVNIDKGLIYNKFIGSFYGGTSATILQVINKSDMDIQPPNDEPVINSSLVELKMELHKNNEIDLPNDKKICTIFNNSVELIKNKKVQIEEDEYNIIIAITDAIKKNNSDARVKINSHPDIVKMVIDKIKNIPDNNYIIEYKIDIIEDDTYCDFEIKINI